MSFPLPKVHAVIPDDVEHPEQDLTPAELHRAASFRFHEDRRRWIAFRSSLRRILAGYCNLAPRDIPLASGQHGKPMLSPPFDTLHFNLSHGEHLGLIAVGSSPVGIDLEPTSRATSLLGCESSFCHPEEIIRLSGEPLTRSLELLTIWIAKESVLKALGTGLLHPPEKIFVDLRNGYAHADDPITDLARIRFEEYAIPHRDDHVAFLARFV